MFDMFKMLGKLNEVKAEAGKVKEELKEIRLEAKDKEGLVTVVATADKNIHGITIDPTVMFPENKEKLENAVLEATQNALRAAADTAKELIKERINDKYPEIAGMGLDKWLS